MPLFYRNPKTGEYETLKIPTIKGDQGPVGPQGPPGTGVTIRGSYPDYEALITTNPQGEPGDSYMVQGDLYVWNQEEEAWDNVGRIQGPQGETGEQGPQGIQGPKGNQGERGPQG